MVKWTIFPRKSPIPEIVSDGIESDPECLEIVERLARFDQDIIRGLRKGGSPIGLKCSNIDLIAIMRSHGGRLETEIQNEDDVSYPRYYYHFEFRSKYRYILTMKFIIGEYKYKNVCVSLNFDGRTDAVNIEYPFY